MPVATPTSKAPACATAAAAASGVGGSGMAEKVAAARAGGTGGRGAGGAVTGGAGGAGMEGARGSGGGDAGATKTIADNKSTSTQPQPPNAINRQSQPFVLAATTKKQKTLACRLIGHGAIPLMVLHLQMINAAVRIDDGHRRQHDQSHLSFQSLTRLICINSVQFDFIDRFFTTTTTTAVVVVVAARTPFMSQGCHVNTIASITARPISIEQCVACLVQSPHDK